MGKNIPLSRHHLIQRCEKEKYNVHDQRNIKVMKHIQHVALHSLFHNLTSPKEQLAFLKDLYINVLSDETKAIFETLINCSDKDFYAKWIVK